MITEQLIPLLKNKKEKLKLVQPPTIKLWEQGTRSPLLKNVDQICKANDLKVLVYDGNLDMVDAIFNYLGFKLDCLKDQEEVGIDLDIDLVHKSMVELEKIIDNKVNILS